MTTLNNINEKLDEYLSDNSSQYSDNSNYDLKGSLDNMTPEKDGKSKPRYENSLGVLTNNFVKLIKESPELTLD